MGEGRGESLTLYATGTGTPDFYVSCNLQALLAAIATKSGTAKFYKKARVDNSYCKGRSYQCSMSGEHHFSLTVDHFSSQYDPFRSINSRATQILHLLTYVRAFYPKSHFTPLLCCGSRVVCISPKKSFFSYSGPFFITV